MAKPTARPDSDSRSDPDDTVQAGKAPDQVGKPPLTPGASSPQPEDPDLALPHERDESVGAVEDEPREVMRQAKRDLDAGMVDTDMRATPGLDAARRARMVPGTSK